MKNFYLLIILFFLVLSLCGCNTTQKTNKKIDCVDVISIYEEAGFYVFHRDDVEEVYSFDCYIQAKKNEDDSNYIYIHFFESHEEAVTYSEDRQYNIIIWLYSLACFNPRWLTTKVYNNMEIEYDDSSYYKPLKSIL